ncbi:MAG: DNA modification methylase [bacterium]
MPKYDSLNAICPYFTMFPLSVPSKQLQEIDSVKWILDPFCGRGTTNYAARLLGLPSVGVDSSPIATAIAEGKLVDTVPEAIEKACLDILTSDLKVELPEGDFWKLCYHPSTLKNILLLRKALLQDCSSPERKALRALMLGILHGPRNKGLPSYLSNQMPRTYAAKPNYAVRFWSKKQLKPIPVDIIELVSRKARYYFASRHPSVSFKVLCSDSRIFDFSALGIKFAKVITSPPYFGMRTYIPDQWLRYWFLGGPENVIYQYPNQMTHSSSAEYAEQLSTIWSNIGRACSPGAKLMIRFGGIHVRKAKPKDIMLASLRETKHQFRLLTIRSAGLSSRGKRQAEQFKRTLKSPIEEFDFYVRVEG